MPNETPLDPAKFVLAIRRRGLSIYDAIQIGDPDYWIPTPELEALLDAGLRDLNLSGLPNRTRSKVAKAKVCSVLGYPTPKSFKKTQPRFPGQKLDTYVQKKNNLQVWNEELEPTRRYVLIRVSSEGIVRKVKVVTGETLARLDTTGTLTSKYQARCIPGASATELVAPLDTEPLRPLVSATTYLGVVPSPLSYPSAGKLLTIEVLFRLLSPLVGRKFPDAGFDQERLRGAALHRIVCEELGYKSYQDDGRFPDVRHQLLEVKLQTSPTVDLGLVRPNSTEPLDVPMINQVQIRHCDVRYAVVYATISSGTVELKNVFLTTGESFFNRFPQFQGKVLNAKLQIPLPAGFFT